MASKHLFQLAHDAGMNEEEYLAVLSNKSFAGQTPDEVALNHFLAVVVKYKLDPLMGEVVARFMDGIGLQPVVTYDGWARLANDHELIDGVEFRYSPDHFKIETAVCHAWIECILHVKGRRDTVIREYFQDNYRSPFMDSNGRWVNQTWRTRPHKRLRNIAFCEACKLGLSFTGIYTADDIAEPASPNRVEVVPDNVVQLRSKVAEPNTVDHSIQEGSNAIDPATDLSSPSVTPDSNGLPAELQRSIISRIVQLVSKAKEYGQDVLPSCEEYLVERFQGAALAFAREQLEVHLNQACDDSTPADFSGKQGVEASVQNEPEPSAVTVVAPVVMGSSYF